MDLIVKLTRGETITDTDLENELYQICERVHSSCDSECPVYRLNGNTVPDTANDFKVNRGCDCFKSGKKMLAFIRTFNETPLQPEVYSLCEAVADIAFIAGTRGYYSGDTRKDIATFIEWAQEFEKLTKGTHWGIDGDYIDAISNFTNDKLNP